MAKKNESETRQIKSYSYFITQLADGTYDLDSYNDTKEFVFFGRDTHIKNVDVDRIIRNIEKLIDTKRNITELSYNNNKLILKYEEYYNDLCSEYNFVFNISNKVSTKNRFEEDIKELIKVYNQVKKETDRNIKIQRDRFNDSDRIAKIVYKLIENYKRNDFYSLRIDREDIPKVINYINNHQSEIAKKAKMHKNSIKYNAIIKLPVALNALSLGAVVAPFVTKFSPSNDFSKVALNATVFTTLYNIFIAANPEVRDFLKTGPASKELDKFLKQYKELNDIWLIEYNQDNMEFNYEFSHVFNEMLDKLDKLVLDNSKRYNLKNITGDLRNLRNDYSMSIINSYFKHKGKINIYLFLNRLVVIERELFNIIDGKDFIYDNNMLQVLLKISGISIKQIKDDEFLQYVINDYNYLNKNRYDGMEMDIMDLFSITLEYLNDKRMRYEEIRRGNNYLPSYLTEAMSKLAILEKNIANNMGYKGMKKR